MSGTCDISMQMNQSRPSTGRFRMSNRFLAHLDSFGDPNSLNSIESSIGLCRKTLALYLSPYKSLGE